MVCVASIHTDLDFL